MRFKTNLTRWLVVVGFAAAMAWVESAVVLYLRTLMGRLEPYQPTPLPEVGGLALAELVREAATLVMLALVGWLAGRTWPSRIGFFLLAFGVWDIGYYIFLVPLTGWPRSLPDWDVLFLIPLPWWGQVLAPILIASPMIIGGSLLALLDAPTRPPWPPWWAVVCNLAGVAVALYVFMADAISATLRGGPSTRELLLSPFAWPVFLIAVALMAVPVIAIGFHVWRHGHPAAERRAAAGKLPNP